ncbi:MAG: cysteine desulfurase family protein [Fimbriimonadaceae bacterium]|nr:cysteine desulfurase family protein [Fimbriimonadaceae bacterium]
MMARDRIYLDYAATTPLDPAVRKAMLPWLDAGNASSQYAEGRRARAAVDLARERVSQALGVDFGSCLFTGSGTEAATLAVVGAALARRPEGRDRVLLSSADHHCVTELRSLLERLGFRVTMLTVRPDATVDVAVVTRELDATVALVSTMHVNNEVGTFNPIPEIAAAAHAVGAWHHTDAVQSFTKVSWTMDSLGTDLVTVSAHKIYGPKGVGAIAIRPGVKLISLAPGGGQEREMRGGTENVAGIVGFGEAVRRAEPADGAGQLRARLRDGLAQIGATLTIPRDVPTLATHVHVRFPGIPAETLLIRLDQEGVAASAGAACSSGSLEPSHVLQAMGWDEVAAAEGVRFTIGHPTTSDEIDEALRRIQRAVAGIRSAQAVPARAARRGRVP